VIDPHVHLRDGVQSPKETLEHGFAVAWRAGISGLFEMPNTDPPLTGREAITARIAAADAARERLGVPIFHGIYGGITDDPRQLEEVVSVHAELFPRVVGFKFFAGHSTGRMGVVTREQQRRVWQTLAALDYRGVVAVHAETEDLLRPDLWDPARPITHGAARPVAAEIHSVRQQIELATEAGFTGRLHIVHVTTTEVLEVIATEGARAPFAVRGGVTPHHALLKETWARTSDVAEWKVNPPLRDVETQEQLLARVEAGEVDWIESDHAPHTWRDKIEGASGMPGIPAFRLMRDRLLRVLPGTTVDRLTGGAVLEAFGIPRTLIPVNPHAGERVDYRELATEYPWDPYRVL